ncbi:hypothetical protein [Microbacterium sp. CFBP9034]|uniref:hypothetical protein n=1 Tax=Microbacterium sp. CFBP9034 TaxID=3096540 RepID=UPI002A6AEFF1|nr:hypothetical protein [Microbacterium sp. CFBP9034]MDY0909924.1 hypothetical protein [Microbacterium sp. CFBP9034]
MGVLSIFGRRRRRSEQVTDEERIARYVYLLNTLPAAVIERAHAAAFRDLPVEERRELFEQLRPFMSDEERAAPADDPTVLAALVRRAEGRRSLRADAGGGDGGDPRDAVDSRTLLLTSGVAVVVAQNFLTSAAVMTYFTAGAGSLGLAGQPAWIGDSFDPGAGGYSGIDGGGGDYGGGGGYDGGGFGGGFDGGGFGGGGDGGGGFG